MQNNKALTAVLIWLFFKHESIADYTLRSVKTYQVIIEYKVDYGNTFGLNKTSNAFLFWLFIKKDQKHKPRRTDS